MLTPAPPYCGVGSYDPIGDMFWRKLDDASEMWIALGVRYVLRGGEQSALWSIC